jgi:hypothetical protein
MRHTEFTFVDLAVGGATKRNNVVKLDKLPIPKDATDTYTTMFRFREEYQKHVDTTGSVRGASKFEVWSDYLWFDIDASDLQDATIDMQALLRGIKSMGVIDETIVYFSGSKGYHVGIDSGVFGFEPSQDLPDRMRYTCTQIASLFHVEIDTKIYNHNRLWRVPNTYHSKTKLRKTQLDMGIAMESSIEDIKKIASSSKNRGHRGYVLCDNVVPVESLVKLSHETSVGSIEKSANWDAPPLSDSRAKMMLASLDILLARGATRGDRDNEALLRASECRKLGFSEDDTLTKVLTWNKLNDPPLSSPDVDRVIVSAFTGAGYDFGTHHPSLKEAREAGRKSIEEIDVDALLSGDIGTDDDDEVFVRRPRTLTELLDGGDAPPMPELVGEWFSWRKRITLLVGREKLSGKSTICTFECVAALRKGYRVLWISPDEPCEDIVYRFAKAGGSEFSDQCIIAGDMNVPTSWSELGSFIAEAKPDIVILDSIHSIFPIINNGKIPDSSESAEWQKLVSKLRPLAIALNTAIVWLHHANKSTGLSTGSIGITSAVDAIVTMTPARKENRRQLSFIGRRVNSSNNCAIDYIDEVRGYKHVKDWDPKVQNEHDEKSKNEIVLDWLRDFVKTHDGDTFERSECAQAYRDHFKEDPDQGRAFKSALSELRKVGEIGMGTKVVGSGLTYKIAQPAKASDLTRGN